MAEKEYRPGLIVIKLKKVQVEPVHAYEPDALELVEQTAHFRILTDNLPVEAFAGVSGHSAKKRKDWLLRLGSGRLR